MKIIICILFLARQDSFEQNEVNGLSGTLMYRMLSGLNGLSGTTMYDAFRLNGLPVCTMLSGLNGLSVLMY